MRISHISISHAGPDSHDSHRKIVITHIIANLFQTSQRGKISDRIGKNMKAFRGHPGGHPGHILFGDARIQESIRKLGLKGLNHGIAKISHHQKDPRIPACFDQQLFDKGGSQAVSL
jgi:hypothetical protein